MAFTCGCGGLLGEYGENLSGGEKARGGQGLTLANTAGIRTGCITGRESAALLRRAHEMRMEFIYVKQPMKIPAYEEILRKAAHFTTKSVAGRGAIRDTVELILKSKGIWGKMIDKAWA